MLKFILLLLFFSNVAYGQNLITTSVENNYWLDSIKALPLNNQLSAIKERILADTIVFVRQFYPDRIKIKDSLGNRVYGSGKPQLLLNNRLLVIDNGTKANEIIQLSNLLIEKYIGVITVLNSSPATSAIYGSAGGSGIILLSLRKKKYLKYFRRLKLKSNGYQYL